MKILFLINQFAGGGRERRMVELVKGLNSVVGIQMHTIVFHESIDYKDVLSTNMTYDCVKEKNRKARCLQIEKIIASYLPDIVHSWVDTHTEMLLLGHLKKKYGYKYIAGFVADGNKNKKLSFRHLTMLYTFRKADAVVSNSKAGLLAKGVSKEKGYVIYNGFDFNRIPIGIDKIAKFKELGVKTQYLVVMCARVNAAKDWDSYIRLASLAKEAEMDITFLAIGYGNMLENYQGITNSPDSNIRFIGRRTDIEEIFCVADLSILFTNSKKHAEGVSNSILESMASGTPVIGTYGGGTPEIIEDGRNGYIIKEFDSETAFARLRKIIKDKRLYDAISCGAVETVKEKFSIDRMVSSYIDLYFDLLAHK